MIPAVQIPVGVYRCTPIRMEGRAPVFLEMATDPYARNYERIAHDHLAAVRHGQGNPFIDEDSWQAIERNTFAFAQEHFPSHGAVLDVGVGTGRLLSSLPAGRKFGIDISATYVRELAATGIELAVGRVETLPYLDAMFDLVLCTDVLEHVLDLHAAVGELQRVLRPGARLVIRVPYREDLSPYLDPGYPYALAHVRAFDEFALEILFTRVFGFRLMRIGYDRALIAAKLRWPVPRGKITLTRFLGALARRFPGTADWVSKQYSAVEVTMVFEKSEIAAR